MEKQKQNDVEIRVENREDGKNLAVSNLSYPRSSSLDASQLFLYCCLL